jgi:hypothetical protein
MKAAMPGRSLRARQPLLARRPYSCARTRSPAAGLCRCAGTVPGQPVGGKSSAPRARLGSPRTRLVAHLLQLRHLLRAERGHARALHPVAQRAAGRGSIGLSGKCRQTAAHTPAGRALCAGAVGAHKGAKVEHHVGGPQSARAAAVGALLVTRQPLQLLQQLLGAVGSESHGRARWAGREGESAGARGQGHLGRAWAGDLRDASSSDQLGLHSRPRATPWQLKTPKFASYFFRSTPLPLRKGSARSLATDVYGMPDATRALALIFSYVLCHDTPRLGLGLRVRMIPDSILARRRRPLTHGGLLSEVHPQPLDSRSAHQRGYCERLRINTAGARVSAPGRQVGGCTTHEWISFS